MRFPRLTITSSVVFVAFAKLYVVVTMGVITCAS